MYNINGYNKLSHFIFPINMNYTYNSNSKGIKSILKIKFKKYFGKLLENIEILSNDWYHISEECIFHYCCCYLKPFPSINRKIGNKTNTSNNKIELWKMSKNYMGIQNNEDLKLIIRVTFKGNDWQGRSYYNLCLILTYMLRDNFFFNFGILSKVHNFLGISMYCNSSCHRTRCSVFTTARLMMCYSNINCCTCWNISRFSGLFLFIGTEQSKTKKKCIIKIRLDILNKNKPSMMTFLNNYKCDSWLKIQLITKFLNDFLSVLLNTYSSSIPTRMSVHRSNYCCNGWFFIITCWWVKVSTLFISLYTLGLMLGTRMLLIPPNFTLIFKHKLDNFFLVKRQLRVVTHSLWCKTSYCPIANFDTCEKLFASHIPNSLIGQCLLFSRVRPPYCNFGGGKTRPRTSIMLFDMVRPNSCTYESLLKSALRTKELISRSRSGALRAVALIIVDVCILKFNCLRLHLSWSSCNITNSIFSSHCSTIPLISFVNLTLCESVNGFLCSPISLISNTSHMNSITASFSIEMVGQTGENQTKLLYHHLMDDNILQEKKKMIDPLVCKPKITKKFTVRMDHSFNNFTINFSWTFIWLNIDIIMMNITSWH
ncbi:hypothetical protein AGLY_002738 [Aphis glycines]|uniref:Uncharacterized protein n=1 Tax=Aphis glycines TaxID=307491 RepID=A0A6G0U1I4_APHGL|nr:hypothetical protein AGLY_002738 [Aphis glycines]